MFMLPLKNLARKGLTAMTLTHWALWHHMATEIWVNTGSGNGLLPDGTKPLPEPMLTYR